MFLITIAAVMCPISFLTDVMNYVIPLLNIPILMLFPVIFKHLYFNFSKKVKIVDGIYAFFALLLII